MSLMKLSTSTTQQYQFFFYPFVLLRFLSLFFLSTLFSEQKIIAAPALDFSIHQPYVSTRALGMGNAFSAVADDHSAMFYNPAGLARREDGNLHFFLRGALDPEVLKLQDEISKTDKKGTEAEQIQNMVKLLENHYGDHFSARVPTLGASWVRPRWGIAFIPADVSLDMSLHQQVGPMINVNGYAESTLAYSYGRDVKWLPSNHRLSAGATLKAIHRIFVGTAVSAGELASGAKVFDKKDGDEGLTVDMDLGFLWDPPSIENGFFQFLTWGKPSFAFVVRNVADYGFTTNLHLIDKASGQPPKLGRRFDLGGKWSLPKFWVFDPHFSFDVRDMGHDNWNWKKGLHAGAELYWRMTNWWKGSWSVGMNQSYLTAGIGARLAWFQLDVATYGEEVGTLDSPKENRRYMLELSIDI